MFLIQILFHHLTEHQGPVSNTRYFAGGGGAFKMVVQLQAAEYKMVLLGTANTGGGGMDINNLMVVLAVQVL